MELVKTSDKIKAFSKNFSLRRFPAKQILITPHTSPVDFFYVEKGYVRSFIASQDGDELSINIFGEATLLPLNPFYESSQPCPYFFETLTECELRVIPNAKMFDFLRESSEAKANAESSYVQSVNHVLNKANQIIFYDCSYRIIYSLVSLAENLGIVEENSVVFKLKISHELIATLAGTTRETVTRKLGELKSKGVIQSNYGRLRILKIDELLHTIR